MHRHQAIRRGLSLIELLVAFAILATITALVAASISRVKESALRSESANKLRQIGIALHHIAANEGGSIPSIKCAVASGVASDPIHLNDRSPLYELLPYLDQPYDYMALALMDRAHRPPNWTWIPTYLSRADPGVMLLDPIRDGDRDPCSFSFNLTAFEGLPKLPDSFPDGTSNTIAYTERYCAFFNKEEDFKHRTPQFPFELFQHYYMDAPRHGNFGILVSRRASFADPGWTDVLPVTNGSPPITTASQPGQTFQVRPPVRLADSHYPASPYHGLLVLMFDGSVRLILPRIAETAFWGSVTRNRGESVSLD